MSRRPLVIAIVALLLALLLAPIVLLIFIGPVAAPSAIPSDTSTSPLQSLSPTPSAEAAIEFIDATSPDEAAWYQIGADARVFPPLLQIGTMAEGVTFELEMADPTVNPNATVPLRPVLGVGDGVVVIVEDDRRNSRLRAVVAATGAVHDLLVSDDVIVNGVLDRDGRIAYFLTADRVTGDLTGAWRLGVGEGNRPDPIVDLVAAAPEFRLAAINTSFSRMLLSPDGSTLGVFRCGQVDCSLRAVRTDDGSLVGDVRIPAGGGDPFAVTDRFALLRPIAPAGPMRFGELVELGSGERAPMPFEGWPFGAATVIVRPDGPFMVVQSMGFRDLADAGPPDEPPEVALVGIPDMAVVDEFAPRLASVSILDVDDASVGVDLPPGWILMWGSEVGDDKMSVFAMNAVDGSVMPLPGVGEPFIRS